MHSRTVFVVVEVTDALGGVDGHPLTEQRRIVAVLSDEAAARNRICTPLGAKVARHIEVEQWEVDGAFAGCI